MKKSFTLAVLSASLMIACHTKKQTTDNKPAAQPPAASAPGGNGGAGISIATVPAHENSYYAPGQEELEAVRVNYPDANLQQLQEGHTLYTKTACVGCHPAKDIYMITSERWVPLLENMTYRAHLSPPEKAAVSRYVFAIKARQTALGK